MQTKKQTPKTESKKSFAVIWKYLKPYKKPTQVALVFVFLEKGLQLSLPLIFGKIIDLTIKGAAFFQQVFILLTVWVAITLLANWFMRIRMRRVAVIAYKASADLITSSIGHLLKLPLAYHKEKKVGEVIQRMSRADQYLYRFIEDGIFYMLPTLVSAFLAFVFIAWINLTLGFVYLIFVLVHMAITVIKTKPIVKYQTKMNRFNEKIYGDIFDRTPNILNIKSNTTEELEDRRNIDGFEKGNTINFKQYILWGNLNLGQTLVVNAGLLAFFGLGLYFVSNGKITIGNFVTLLGFVNMLNAYLFLLGFYYKSMQEGLVTINRSEAIFAQKPEAYENPNAKKITNCQGAISFKNVSFAYEKEAVLKDISFEIPAGKMVAIVGKSGEGKSTLVNLISRYIEPQKGKVLLDGTDIKKLSLLDLREQIAIVPQEISLFNDTIANNIRYSNVKATDKQVELASKMANCHEFIEKFPKKYQQMVGERGVKLSTGQKQRVAIARAILRNPKILILDEATSALDSESEKLVQEALNEVMQKRTSFVIAHRLSTIRKADLILVIENGMIAESGTHQDLISKGGIYQKLSELQQLSV